VYHALYALSDERAIIRNIADEIRTFNDRAQKFLFPLLHRFETKNMNAIDILTLSFMRMHRHEEYQQHPDLVKVLDSEKVVVFYTSLLEYLKKRTLHDISINHDVFMKNLHGIIDIVIDKMIIDIKCKIDICDEDIIQIMTYHEMLPERNTAELWNFKTGKVTIVDFADVMPKASLVEKSLPQEKASPQEKVSLLGLQKSICEKMLLSSGICVRCEKTFKKDEKIAISQNDLQICYEHSKMVIGNYARSELCIDCTYNIWKNEKMGFGKYTNLTPNEVVKINPNYLQWAMRKTARRDRYFMYRLAFS
jgi:hypothetical protein